MQLAVRNSIVVAVFALSAVAAASPRSGKHAAWFAGIPIELTITAENARGASTRIPTPARIYITAPTFSDAAFAATTIQIDGQRRVFPAHDVVVDQFISDHAAAPAMTFFVVPGAKATADTVRSVVNTSDSIPAGPLAREIFVGTDWVRLNSHVIVEYGVAMGWLALEPYPQSESITTRYLGKPADFAVKVSLEGRR